MTADNRISQLLQPRDGRRVDPALGEQSQHRFGPFLIGDDQRVIGFVRMGDRRELRAHVV